MTRRKTPPITGLDPLIAARAERRQLFAVGFLRYINREPVDRCINPHEKAGWTRAQLVERVTGMMPSRKIVAELAKSYGDTLGRRRKREPDDKEPVEAE